MIGPAAVIRSSATSRPAAATVSGHVPRRAAVGRRRRAAGALLAGAAAVAGLGGGPAARGQEDAGARTDVLVKTGDAAPDGNGTFQGANATGPTFEGPALNDAGQVAFGARIQDAAGAFRDTGVFRADGGGAGDPAGGVAQIARGGAAAPDGDGRYLSFAGRAVAIDGAGRVAFEAFIGNTFNGSFAVLRGAGAAVETIARATQPAPGGEYRFPPSGLDRLGVNDAGEVLFQAQVDPPGDGPDVTGLYVGRAGADPGVSGPAREVVRAGRAAPGGNGTFNPLLTDESLTADGRVVFHAQLNDTARGGRDNSGVFRAEADGSLTTLARAGQAVPGGEELFFTGDVAANDRGEAAFVGTLFGTFNDGAVYRADGAVGPGGDPVLTQIAREGGAVPGGPGELFSLSDPVINDRGQVAFEAFLSRTGSQSDTHAILRGDGDVLEKIARSGDAAPTSGLDPAGPGAATRGEFALFGFAPLGDLAIAETGAVVFEASTRTGPGGDALGDGLFVGDGRDLLAVVREGDAVAGGVVDSIEFDFEGGLNDLGQVAYAARLTDGRGVLNRWTPDLRYRGGAAGSLDDAGDFTLGLDPTRLQNGAAVYDVFLDSDVDATVAGPAGDSLFKSLTVGGGAGEVALELAGGAVTVAEGLALAAGGTLLAAGADLTVLGDLAQAGALVVDAATAIGVGGDLVLMAGAVLAADPDFAAVMGETYDILTVAGTRTGLFRSAGGDVLNEGDLFGTFGGTDVFLTYAGGDGNDVALFAPAAVPEPATWALLTLAAAGGAWRTRRRRAA